MAERGKSEWDVKKCFGRLAWEKKGEKIATTIK